MSNEKFEEAKRLHQESVEKFKAAHDEAERLLARTDDLAERNEIRFEYGAIERQAMDQTREAIRLQYEAIEESRLPEVVSGASASAGASPAVLPILRRVAEQFCAEQPDATAEDVRTRLRQWFETEGGSIDEKMIEETLDGRLT